MRKKSIPKNKHDTYNSKKRFAIAACTAAVLFFAALAANNIRNNAESDKASKDIAEVPRWDDKTITEKYPAVLLNDISWSIESTPLDEQFVKNKIDQVTATGYDIYEGKEYTADCTLYEIYKVSDACAVALKFDDSNEYYPCVNMSNYKPKTLQDLIDDLNLHDNLTFNCVYLEQSVKFESPDPSVIWEMLLSDTDVKNSGEKYYKLSLMDISIDVDVIGAKNISLAVNKYGYLQTNILGTAKSFYIGEDKVQAFIDYVLENCQKIE